MSNQIIVDTPENWDAASQGYAEKIAPFLMESFAQEFIDRLDVDLDTEALEVAAGSGALTVTLAKRIKALLATDFSPKMIGILKSRMNDLGITNVSYAIMDGQALKLDDNVVDRAACNFGLMLFPDRNKGFKELNRVVRPGGKVIVSGWASPDRFEAFGLFMAALQRAFPNLPRPDTPPPVFSLSDLDVFKDEMKAAGFVNVDVGYAERELVVRNTEDFWSMLTVGAPPIKLLFDKVGTDGQKRLRESVTEVLKDRFGSGEILIVNTATFGVGTVA